jgi:hypothetical protein
MKIKHIKQSMNIYKQYQKSAEISKMNSKSISPAHTATANPAAV